NGTQSAPTFTYKYCVSTASGTCNNFTTGSTAGATSASISGLTAATLYYFRISAVDSGNSTITYSNELSATTAAAPPTFSGTVTCNAVDASPYNASPKGLRITFPNATQGSHPITGYDLCWSTSASGCNTFAADYSVAGATPGATWIGTETGV